MSVLILEFPLEEGCATVNKDRLTVNLGNGVNLISSVPTWVKSVQKAVLRLEMEIDGSPEDAITREPPVG